MQEQMFMSMNYEANNSICINCTSSLSQMIKEWNESVSAFVNFDAYRLRHHDIYSRRSVCPTDTVNRIYRRALRDTGFFIDVLNQYGIDVP